MFTDKDKILEQYQNSSNLNAPITLHKRFSTAKHDYHSWIFDHIQAPVEAEVLELGTGSAKLWQVNRERIPQGWNITHSDISEGMLGDAKKNVTDISRDFSFQVVDAQQILFENSSFDLSNSKSYALSRS